MSQPLAKSDPYSGLRRAEATLPAADYFEPAAYERDLSAIWYRNWIFACRASELATPLAFKTLRVGSQEVLVVRDETGALRAFHNTCRHRGSQLCRESEGRLKARLITCPYHAWSYSLRGELVRVPSKTLPEGFDRKDFPLYPVAIAEWRGFVFINLAAEPDAPLHESFDPESGDLGNWPLEDLVVGHSFTKIMACNWKIFWENFNECLHCPGVHKHLSKLVPIYGRGLMARHDDPDWAKHADNDAPEFSGSLRTGAETWSRDGKAHGPAFPNLSERDRAAGQTYVMNLPSMFVVGHVDYVRLVRLMPLGPEKTQLTAEWLFTPEQLASPDADLDNIVSFGTEVLEEDADVCELNQRGLRALPHRQGVLMPEEYELHRFHDWVRSQHECHGA